uniref:Uncharacterized protein n=1 Tax=Lactuca sativa TaxID=4236 RepID=A0A9R1UC77_LACSA|nr:hypothetical protein LSAT_V11C900462290 [Lactuca sativa]
MAHSIPSSQPNMIMECNGPFHHTKQTLNFTCFCISCMNLWLSIPEDKKSSFTRLDPLWYTLYSSDSNKEKVLNWIKKKDIFSRKYVVFPIVQW